MKMHKNIQNHINVLENPLVPSHSLLLSLYTLNDLVGCVFPKEYFPKQKYEKDLE
jgi:hypothetical protein